MDAVVKGQTQSYPADYCLRLYDLKLGRCYSFGATVVYLLQKICQRRPKPLLARGPDPKCMLVCDKRRIQPFSLDFCLQLPRSVIST